MPTTSPEHRDQIIMQRVKSDIGETSINADADVAHDITINDDDDDRVQGVEHVPHTRINRKRAKRVSFEDTIIDDAKYDNKKSVSFSNISEMFVVPDLRTIGISKTALFYTLEDMNKLKFNHLRKIHTTRLRLSIGDQTTEIVGLEKHLSSALSIEFKRRKTSHFEAVINELEFQDEYCSQPNPDRLAAISRNHSRWALEQAQYAAKLLADDISTSSTASKKLEKSDDVSTSSTETASMSESDDSSSSTSSSKYKVEYEMRRLTIDAVSKDCMRAVAA